MSYNTPASQNQSLKSSANQTERPKLTRRMVENIYIGDRYYAFEKYFDRFRENGGRYFFNFSWAAFFFGIFWLFYRKMYREGFFVLGIIIVIAVIEMVFNTSARYFGLFISISLAVEGRRWYWHSMNRSINKARHMYRSQRSRALAWLKTQGGTNIWFLVLAIISDILSLYLVFGV